ncbi:cytochrome c4 [Candidatus Photodesmus blepharus]|uniref:Cytochrome c4 n=1 Tax=Candidatus Photodesmus blepharonis TaxID=1179155 RepID=A0A084CNS6_9GAMM|nr:c-type cytochrome [Candidatus Photodesmus blepharus]KEY91455.1 cytochrome c4 [Candidatus Photodesmus blepharus]
MKKFALILNLFISCFILARESVEAGKIKSAICSACHGVDGNSQLTMYPKLAGQHAKYIEKQLKDFQLSMKSNGESGRADPVMGGIAISLSTQDIADLAVYYSSLKMSFSTTSDNAIDKGKILYTAGDPKRSLTACIACHGPRGNGTKLSGFPKISGQHPEYLKTQLQKFRSGSRKHDMMQDISKKLTNEDISILSEYISGLH